MPFTFDNPTAILIAALSITAVIGVVVMGSIAFSYVLVLWIRNRHRESVSLNSTLLQITVPINNETKIDTAEQMFSGLAAIRRIWSNDRMWFFKAQPHLTFEIVGLTGDIRFYAHVPKEYRDFIEKQINGAYPDAEITLVTDTAAKQKESMILG